MLSPVTRLISNMFCLTKETEAHIAAKVVIPEMTVVHRERRVLALGGRLGGEE